MGDGALFEQIPRTVKPRKTGYTHLPLLAVRHGLCMTENGVVGEVAKVDWRRVQPLLVVGVNLAYLVAELDEKYRSDPDWQWRGRDDHMEVGTVATQHRTIVDFFGFRANRERGHATNHYHRCLDAYSFYSNTYTLGPETTDTVEGLMTWAIKLRDYCKTENLPLKATASGIAASYLRDPRFYGEPRRKVPRATNAAIRPALPGNHYQLLVGTRNKESRWHALEIDQVRAHHYHAETVPMPDANTLFAFGDFEGMTSVTTENPRSDFLGLYYMRLQLPSVRNGKTRRNHPRWSPISGQSPGLPGFFVFSNELPMLANLGYKLGGIIAGWGSREMDKGLPLYARHCQQQLDEHENGAWLKPILLSTYGLLAVKPRAQQAVYRQADGGEPFVLFAGGRRTLHGLLVQHTNGNQIEPGIANVLHRGMIEAATRATSLELALYLEYHGQWVLQVYADSVIIEDNPDRPLPFLPEPWRVKQKLTDYRPINMQAFTSVEKTRMPGVAREETLRASRGTVGQAPIKQLTEALSGRTLNAAVQRARGIEPRRI